MAPTNRPMPTKPGKQNEPPGPGSIGKATKGKLKGNPKAIRGHAPKKATKAPPGRPADAGSANETNQLARQVADRVAKRNQRFAGPDAEQES